MLINSKKLLKYARENHFAIPATNFTDLNSVRTFVNTACDLNLPLICSFAQSHLNMMSLEEAALVGKFFAERSKAPVVLHLDHGEDFDTIVKAIDLGFTSVMIDKSMESFEKNIEYTKKVADYAKRFDVSVEAELGHVGANDFSESKEITDSVYTRPEDALEFVSKTKVDSLAVSIGTAHGVYKGKPEINFEILEKIANAVDIPLVLHGGSGTGDSNLKRCAQNAIAKINIYTDFNIGAFNAVKNDNPSDYPEMKKLADQAMRDVLKKYFEVFETKEFPL